MQASASKAEKNSKTVDEFYMGYCCGLGCRNILFVLFFFLLRCVFIVVVVEVVSTYHQVMFEHIIC